MDEIDKILQKKYYLNSKEKKHYLNSKEKKYKSNKLWREAHKEKTRAYSRNYYLVHKEKHLQHMKDYYLKNREKIIKNVKDHQKKKKEKASENHSPMHSKPFQYSCGPRNAKIILLGEAWGEQEAIRKIPFVGAAGQELNRILHDAGLKRHQCFLTNVFAFQPQGNKIETLCGKKAEGAPGFAPIRNNLWLLPQYIPEIERLEEELRAVKPNLIVALGTTAVWALLNQLHTMKTIRGAISESPYGKILPTYHPAAILRNWSPWRVLAVADLMKAKREMEFPEIIRPIRHVIINPNIEDIEFWIKDATFATHMVVDIETKYKQITCIGFATSKILALVIPFRNNLGESYWPTSKVECQAWKLVNYILSLSAIKIFQNGIYDLQYLFRMGFKPKNCLEDTMLLHHSLYPEMIKDLGSLGSLYTNEAPWKLMRGRNEELKAND